MDENKISERHFTSTVFKKLSEGKRLFFPLTARKCKDGWLFRIPEAALYNTDFLDVCKNQTTLGRFTSGDLLAAARYAISKGEKYFLISQDGGIIKGLSIYS